MYNMHGSERVNRQSDVDGFVRQVPFLGASRSPFYEPKILVLGGTIEERCEVGGRRVEDEKHIQPVILL